MPLFHGSAKHGIFMLRLSNKKTGPTPAHCMLALRQAEINASEALVQSRHGKYVRRMNDFCSGLGGSSSCLQAQRVLRLATDPERFTRPGSVVGAHTHIHMHGWYRTSPWRGVQQGYKERGSGASCSSSSRPCPSLPLFSSISPPSSSGLSAPHSCIRNSKRQRNENNLWNLEGEEREKMKEK